MSGSIYESRNLISIFNGNMYPLEVGSTKVEI